jgi:hypothetical protein
MRVATCVVCGERLNVLQEKLITAEWVDASSGALVAMHFHSPCFVRWYQETASARAKPKRGKENPPALPAPGESAGAAGAAGAAEPAGEAPRAGGERPPGAGASRGASGGGATGQPASETPPEDYLTAAERKRLQELRSRLKERGGDRSGGRASGSGGARQHPEDDQQGVAEDDKAPHD